MGVRVEAPNFEAKDPEQFIKHVREQVDIMILALHKWHQDPSQYAQLEQVLMRLKMIHHSAKLLDISSATYLTKFMIQLIENNHVLEQLKEAYQWLLFSMDDLLRLLDCLENNKPLQISQELIRFYEEIHYEEEEINEPAVPVEIFHEELTEIMQLIEEHIEEYKTSSNEEVMSEIKRHLHTLKGSARLVGFSHLGDFFHHVEDMMEIKTSKATLSVIENMLILLKEALPKILSKKNVKIDYKALEQAQVLSKVPDLANLSSDVPSSSVSEPEEKIRIPLSILERFSQYSSSANIARAHIDEQEHVLKFYLESMMDALNHMEEISRTLLMRADMFYVQSLRSHHAEGEYDVLELDRYSVVQHHARDLHDLTGTLFGIQENLTEALHDLENQLREQKHALGELEESLTHVRMVSFQTLVPRLEKMVEQISHELKKEVRLRIVQVEGEMDKSVLQKLITPLEHMIRNSIDHGIESIEERQKQGKNPNGTIELSLVRQGSHVIIELKDDGRGIDLDAIYKKAIERGLWDKKKVAKTHELLNLIFLPGFSTSRSLTAISGRGIGMDVASHEIRKLGGSLRIDTKTSKGATFTIRLPFTSSINQALIFQGAFQLYGLLVSHISGITRLEINFLKDIYENKKAIHYMGKTFDLKYIGEVLQKTDFSSHDMSHKYLPVILIESNQRRLALIIDKVVGTREVLVKSLGIQMQSAQELLGASVLGDGRIVMMLDPQSLVDKDAPISLHAPSPKNNALAPLILVVDDSSTVRKVTSHLLERNGFQVLTAKDGEEALTLVETKRPDCILLDLEMPKLDGFGFLEALNKSKKNTMPVIVISSRSMDKYKKRAFQLGACEFLSKPFQNEQLLEQIEKNLKGKKNA